MRINKATLRKRILEHTDNDEAYVKVSGYDYNVREKTIQLVSKYSPGIRTQPRAIISVLMDPDRLSDYYSTIANGNLMALRLP